MTSLCAPYVRETNIKDMRTSVKLFALLAAVLMLAACTPEPVEVERDIVYTVDETTTTVHLRTDTEFDALLEQFCDYAEEGSTVTFHNANKSPKGTKDATTFSTTDREAMKRWMAQMEDEGMTVTVTYDPATGTWNGTAYATAPQPPLQGGVATYVNIGFDGMNGGLNVIVTIDSTNSTAYVNFDYDNYWLHMPCGRFENMYEENGRLILSTFPPYEDWSGDTLFIERLGGDTLLIWFAYSGACPANHTHSCLLVPAPQGMETYYSEQVGGIILHVFPNAIETYPAIHLAQFCAPMENNINCICPIISGFCEMRRYYTSIPGLDWELSLRYSYNNDSSYYIVDSLGLNGHEIGSDACDAAPVIIRDLHQYPGCYYEYVFNRIN